MLKKLTSLFLSLLVCLSLLPGQARAAGNPDPVEPPAAVEPVDPETPDGPGCSPLGEDVPVKDDYHA